MTAPASPYIRSILSKGHCQAKPTRDRFNTLLVACQEYHVRRPVNK